MIYLSAVSTIGLKLDRIQWRSMHSDDAFLSDFSITSVEYIGIQSIHRISQSLQARTHPSWTVCADLWSINGEMLSRSTCLGNHPTIVCGELHGKRIRYSFTETIIGQYSNVTLAKISSMIWLIHIKFVRRH